MTPSWPVLLLGLATCVPGTEDLIIDAGIAVASVQGNDRGWLTASLVDRASAPAVRAIAVILDESTDIPDQKAFLLNLISDGWIYMHDALQKTFQISPQHDIVDLQLCLIAEQDDIDQPAHVERAVSGIRSSLQAIGCV